MPRRQRSRPTWPAQGEVGTSSARAASRRSRRASRASMACSMSAKAISEAASAKRRPTSQSRWRPVHALPGPG